MSDPKAKTRLVGGFLRISGARTRNRTKDTGIFNPFKKTKEQEKEKHFYWIILRKKFHEGTISLKLLEK
ncbi:hypothetical protein DDA05_00760 [Escherichia coli]|nr:hypothetical protein [Escherichia coli]